MSESTLRPVTATYRLQLSSAFTLNDARARIPYLKALGISHLYLSPVLAAHAGSTHGYDVVDPTHVSRELGGDEAFVALADEAHREGLGVVLDIVPNHMGIGPDNPFWEDLLAHGAKSTYAGWFDVEWMATTRRLAGKVLLPVLGRSLDFALANDEIGIAVSDRGVRVSYFDHDFPVDPATVPPELELAQRDPAARELVNVWTRGDDGRARLEALLSRQHYELASWRTASRDLNYRRFFDVNELIALRVERGEVFDATHRVVLQMVSDRLVDGLRIDHIDGLLEPRRYLERLRAAIDARRPRGGDEPRFPLLVEKILAPGEQLPADWPVDGTTGYEFMVTLEDVFVDPAGYDRLETRYRTRGQDAGFHPIALDAKRRVLRSALNADVRRIAPMLTGIARQGGWLARSISAYAMVIVELVAALPVYRTYIDADRPEPSPADRAVIEQAFAQVRERGRTDAAATDALELVLLGKWAAPNVDAALARARLAFVLRWQQLTGPAAAKGVEDTALYVYAPLASRNEVGGDPGVPVAGAVDRLHALLQKRVAHHPRSLNATNTHDTKRSADVRSRLDVLSESSKGWERRLAHWRRHNRGLRTLAHGKLAPTRTTDNFIYQSLIGIWPLGRGPARAGDAVSDERELTALQERLTAYIQKAVREAKVSTSWTDPDDRYEEAITRFIAGLLSRRTSGEFLREVEQFVAELEPRGIWNALSRVAIHLTAPGIPDLYQGDELWFQALVDPDNRRPVDWTARERAMGAVCSLAPRGEIPSRGELADLAFTPADGRLKLYLTHRLLTLRRDRALLMTEGSHQVVSSSGMHADRVVAYERVLGADSVLVVAPRLTCGLGPGAPIGEIWGDTALSMQHDGVWRCTLSGREMRPAEGAMRVRELLAILPVAVLVKVE